MASAPQAVTGVDNSTLDACVVLGAMMIVGASLGVLAFVNIPDKNLPVFTSVLAGILMLLTTYGGFRWGSSVTAKRLAGQQGATE